VFEGQQMMVVVVVYLTHKDVQMSILQMNVLVIQKMNVVFVVVMEQLVMNVVNLDMFVEIPQIVLMQPQAVLVLMGRVQQMMAVVVTMGQQLAVQEME
jgi:hypothetical protein